MNYIMSPLIQFISSNFILCVQQFKKKKKKKTIVICFYNNDNNESMNPEQYDKSEVDGLVIEFRDDEIG